MKAHTHITLDALRGRFQELSAALGRSCYFHFCTYYNAYVAFPQFCSPPPLAGTSSFLFDSSFRAMGFPGMGMQSEGLR